MVSLFCLRLALGLVGSLLILNPAQINPRFYRVQFLITLGLTALAAVFLRETADLWLWLALGAGLLMTFAGSVVWSLDKAPGGRLIVLLSTLAEAAALVLAEWVGEHPAGLSWQLLGDATSAALLGSATTAMLMGHSYLIAPSMSLTPLLRLLAALAIATGLRLALAGVGLWCWTAGHSLTNLTDVTVLWLPVRWGVGLIGPLVLAWMAWRTAKVRSTQSATGILYVVVIFCFLGELTSQLLLTTTHYLL